MDLFNEGSACIYRKSIPIAHLLRQQKSEEVGEGGEEWKRAWRGGGWAGTGTEKEVKAKERNRPCGGMGNDAL